jgi:putative transposase
MFVEAAYRFRFFPTPEQAHLLTRTFGCARVVYNRALALRQEAWADGKRKCGFSQTNTMLTEIKKTDDFSWLNEVSSVPLQQSLRHLDRAYSNFFSDLKKLKNGLIKPRDVRRPKFRKKDGKQSAEFTKAGFNYRNGVLKLAKMDTPLNVVWSRDLPSEPSTVTVTREPDGRWYVACRVVAVTNTLTGGNEAVGIDLGLTDLAILSTGEKISNPRHFTSRWKRLAREQRRLSKKQKGSKNRAKAKLKVARAHAAVRHARQDHLHKFSTRLVRENQTIIVEDLCVKGMLKSKRCSKSISDAAWGELVRQLTYKASWYGRQLVKIDRFFPSTKTCSECGTTGHVLPLSVREWNCPDCGAHHDRDVNAAINIRTAGLAGIACGEDVSLGVHLHLGQSSMKQEPDLRSSGIPPL